MFGSKAKTFPKIFRVLIYGVAVKTILLKIENKKASIIVGLYIANVSYTRLSLENKIRYIR